MNFKLATSLQHLAEKNLIVPILTCLIAASIAVGYARIIQETTPISILTPNDESAPAGELQSQATPRPIKAIRLTVTHLGFSPSEIRIPPGRYILDVDNRTGGREILLILDSLDGNKIKGPRPTRGLRDYTGLYDLTPGEYVVRVAEVSTWTARIVVAV